MNMILPKTPTILSSIALALIFTGSSVSGPASGSFDPAKGSLTASAVMRELPKEPAAGVVFADSSDPATAPDPSAAPDPELAPDPDKAIRQESPYLEFEPDASLVGGDTPEKHAFFRRAGAGRLSAELLQDREVDRIEATDDTFVAEGRKSDNFGDKDILYIGGPEDYGKSYSLLRFDMLEIPKERALTKASLEIYLEEAGPSGDSDRVVSMYPLRLGREENGRTCKRAWDEDDPSWDEKPDRQDDVLDQEDIGTSRDRYKLKLDESAKRWRLPDWNRGHRCNNGVELHGDDRDGSFRGFQSTEDDEEPKLRIEHVEDTQAPRGAIEPLPPYLTVPTGADPQEARFSMEWDGDDPEPRTGIERFELYGRVDEERDWRLLNDKVQTYGGNVKGLNGHRYQFAIYPVDPAGNRMAIEDAIVVSTHVDFDPPVATVNELPAYMPGPFELTWTAVDLPNTEGRTGSGLSHYDLHYNIGGGSWGLLASGLVEPRFFFADAQQGAAYQFRVIAYDKANHREAEGAFEAQTSIDGLAPIPNIYSGSTIGRRSFEVYWSSIDPGGSGTVSYDVQYREGKNGPWTDWKIATTETSATFSAELNKTYYFRVRARDRAGNAGLYPAEPMYGVTTITRDSLLDPIFMPLTARP